MKPGRFQLARLGPGFGVLEQRPLGRNYKIILAYFEKIF
jgi:hypothetical protein